MVIKFRRLLWLINIAHLFISVSYLLDSFYFIVFKHKIMSQLVVRTEKAMQSFLIKHPHRTTEQAKPLSEKNPAGYCIEHSKDSPQWGDTWQVRTKNTFFLAASLFRHGWKDLLHLLWQSCAQAVCRASASTQLQETFPSFCNFFSCLQTVQSDLAGLINHTSMTPSSKMFYCSNEAWALRGGSYHYVHLTAREMEAEL